jgi:hypothetical protein
MTTRARKPKSPPVPSRNLRESLDDVRRIYDTYSHGTFSKAEIASTLGLSATSGPFAGRFYTLREYGLIEGSGDSFKVTQAFRDMNGKPPDSAAFKKRALEAIKRSKIFGELLSEWKTKLPPQEAVAKRLEDQKQFNADRAKAIAKVLEESLRQAGVLDANNNILPIRGADGAEEAFAPADEDETLDEVDHADQPNVLKTEIPVGEGRRVVVGYPSDLSKAEAEKVGRVLVAIVE